MILMRVSLLVGEEQVTKDLLSTRKSKEEREERADKVLRAHGSQEAV